MKLPYSEGTWFAVPLGKGEYCIGVVARAAPRGCVMLCYFFGPRRCSLPSLSEVEDLRAGDAVLVARVGDLALVQGDWPVLGQPKIWRRQDWPMPFFIRRAEFSARAWKVHYSDHDPAEVISEEPVSSKDTTLQRDTVVGSGAAEIRLNDLLARERKAAELHAQGGNDHQCLDACTMSVSDQSSQLDCEPDATTTAEEPEEQALLVFLQPDAISKSAEAGSDLGTLEDNLANAIEQRGAGQFDGDETGKGGATLFMYGPDAEKLFSAVAGTLKASFLCVGARVVIRRGGPGAPEREVYI